MGDLLIQSGMDGLGLLGGGIELAGQRGRRRCVGGLRGAVYPGFFEVETCIG